MYRSDTSANVLGLTWLGHTGAYPSDIPCGEFIVIKFNVVEFSILSIGCFPTWIILDTHNSK